MATTSVDHIGPADRPATATTARATVVPARRGTRRQVLAGVAAVAAARLLPFGATAAEVTSATATACGCDEPPCFVRSFGKDPLTPGVVSGPIGVAFGPDGTAWVTDAVLHRVQGFGPDGTLRAVWGRKGSEPGQLLRPTGVAVSADGLVHVVDSGNARVQVFDAAGRYVGGWGGPGSEDGRFGIRERFDPPGPIGIAIGPDGTVHVADPLNHRVQSFSPAGRHLASLSAAGEAGAFRYPFGVALSPDGDTLYVADSGNGRVLALDPNGGLRGVVATRGDAAASLRVPSDVATDADGNVWVVDLLRRLVLVFRPDGTPVMILAVETEFRPHAIAVGPGGDVLVTDPSWRCVHRFAAASGQRLASWGSQRAGGLALPFAAAFAPDGASFYLSDTLNDRVLWHATDGTLLGTVGGGSGSGLGEFDAPLGVAVSVDGTLFVADSGNHRVQAFKAAGGFLRTWGSEGEGKRQFVRPGPIAVAPDGQRLWVGDDMGWVRDFRPIGTPLSAIRLRPSDSDSPWHPAGIAAAADGSLLVSDSTTDKILRLDASGRPVKVWGAPGTGDGKFWNVAGLAVATDGTVYAVDSMNHRVQCFDPRGRFLRAFGGLGGGEGEFAYPDGIALSPDGRHLLVVDTGNDRAQLFCLAGGVAGQPAREV